MTVRILVLVLILGLTCYGEDYGEVGELELLEDLFDRSGYNSLIRPVKQENETIVIGFQIALSQIIHLDQLNQVMKTNVWLQMEWEDYQLEWDEEKYGTDTIRLTPDKVWTPDVILFNNADGVFEHAYDSNVVLSKTGYMYWIPPAIFESSCEIDVEYFPFDQQKCKMYFGSWSYSVEKMNFKYYHGVSIVDVSDYSKSGTWIIIETTCEITTKRKESTNEEIASFEVQFTLRRMTLFYLVNLIIPCILISFASISVFVLPAEECEKITLCISMLLVLVVFLLLISNFLPPASAIPLLAKYLLFNFIMNSLAIVFTVMVINQNFRTPRTHQMPKWVRLLFLNYLPRLMRMTRPDHDERWKNPEDDIFDFPSPDLQPDTAIRRVAMADLREAHHPNCKVHKVTYVSGKVVHKIEHSEECRQKNMPHIHPGAYRTADAIQFLKRHIEKEEKFETILDDWRYVATVADRLLFYVYLVVTICGTVVILMKAPYIFDPKDQDKIIADMVRIIHIQSGILNETSIH